MHEARPGRLNGQRHLGEIHRPQRAASVGIIGELGRHLLADARLRLLRAATDMRRQNHIIDALQRRGEDIAIARRLLRKHIDSGTGDPPFTQRHGQGIEVHNRAAGIVDEDRARLHLGDLGCADHALGRRGLGHMHRYDIGPMQQLIKAAAAAGIAQRQLGHDIPIHHPHAKTLGQDRKLAADIAIADNAQGAATHLAIALRTFRPSAGMGGDALGHHAAQQTDNLAHHQLGHAAGVGEGRVEHHDAALTRCLEVHLVGADAKAAHHHQPVRRLQHLTR